MNKSSLILSVFILIICSACAVQATPTSNLPSQVPTTTASQTPSATISTQPSSTPSSMTVADRYPQIISSADMSNRVISIDTVDPRRIAYCAPGEIRVSPDGGQSWSSVPTTSAADAVGSRGYALFFGDPNAKDTCLSVTLDPNYPEAYYAIFPAAKEEFGAPPVFNLGLYTSNAGETWQMVEPPENAKLEDFGGFWNLGTGSVQAMFFPAGSWSQDPESTLITESADGGMTWEDGILACPEVDPCLRWGPAPSNIPGMGSPLPQSIFYSPDGGENWSVIDPPVELRTPAPNQLVFISDTELLIISGSISLSNSNEATPAVRRSLDAGRSWEPIDLPSLSVGDLSLNYFPGLQYLSNHSYLSQSPDENNWYWLSPEVPVWCPVNTDHLPPYPVLLQNVGDQLWWVDEENNSAESISLSEIGCAES